MAFWCRIKQLKLESLSNQFKRCYFQISGACSVNHTAFYRKIPLLDKANGYIHKNQIEVYNSVRFFAAPVKAKHKETEKGYTGPRLNEQIRAELVRLVTDEGHAVVSRREALDRAKRLKLDLVEVQKNADPPVCKMMDYHKERYKRQLVERDRAKSKAGMTVRTGVCKEVRFTGKIEQNDLKMKADTVKRLMERGYRVKCMAMGNEDEDLGAFLSRLSVLLEDVSVVVSGPRVEKRQAYVIVRHVKFGPSKKGSGKKPSKAGVTSDADQKNNQSAMKFEGDMDPADPGSEMEDVSPLEKPSEDSTWSISNTSDNFEEVFDFSDDIKSSTNEQIKTAPETTFSWANIVPNSMQSRPVLDSARTDTVSSSSLESPFGIENSYKSSSKSAPTKRMDVGGPGARVDSRWSNPQFPNQKGQPSFHPNVPFPTIETKQAETDASAFRNSRLPADETPKQEPLPHGARNPPPSYGIFSSSKADNTAREHGASTESNRYKKRSSFDSRKNLRP